MRERVARSTSVSSPAKKRSEKNGSSPKKRNLHLRKRRPNIGSATETVITAWRLLGPGLQSQATHMLQSDHETRARASAGDKVAEVAVAKATQSYNLASKIVGARMQACGTDFEVHSVLVRGEEDLCGAPRGFSPEMVLPLMSRGSRRRSRRTNESRRVDGARGRRRR